MTLSLSHADVRRLEAAITTAVAPLDYPSIDAWRSAVNARVRELVNGDTAVFALAPLPDVVPAYSDELAPEQLAVFADHAPVDEAAQRVVRRDLTVFSQTTLVAGDWVGYDRDPMVNAFYRPNRLHDALACLVEWPDESSMAHLEVHRDRYGTDLFGEQGEEILRLFRPALVAGVRAVLRLDALRSGMMGGLEALGIAAALVRADGRLVHRTPPLETLLSEDPERGRLAAEVSRAARSLGGIGGRRATPAAAVAGGWITNVKTPGGAYRLSASRVTDQMLGPAPTILVLVEPIGRTMTSAAELMTRYGLTRQESRVARLLVARKTRPEIARELDVSVHTARRHTERVYQKLGVHSRGELEALLNSV